MTLTPNRDSVPRLISRVAYDYTQEAGTAVDDNKYGNESAGNGMCCHLPTHCQWHLNCSGSGIEAPSWGLV